MQAAAGGGVSGAPSHSRAEGDRRAGAFPGADMARTVLQMGWPRARRYANHKGGRKYDKETGAELPRVEDAEKAAVAKPEPPKHPGQIAVFISRKDGKLYVRENFKPLFDVPVTISPSDRLLGTPVFTAQVDKADHHVLRWSVVPRPVSPRSTPLTSAATPPPLAPPSSMLVGKFQRWP